MLSINKERKGALYAVTSGFCYGPLGFFGIMLMREGQSVYSMLFWRSLVSALFVAILLAPQLKILLKKPKDSLQTIFYGAVFYNFSTVVYFMASDYIGTGPAMVIFFTFPAIVMFINRFFFRSPLNRVAYLAFGIIVIGMLMLVNLDEFKVNILGIGVGLIAATLYGSYIIASKKLDMDPLTSTFMVSIGCALSSGIVALGDTSLSIPGDSTTWGYILGLGIISTAVPILLLLRSMKYISSDKAAVLSVTEPVFVVIFGVILLNEIMTIPHALGIVVILSGALLSLFSEHLNDHPLIVKITNCLWKKKL